MQWGWHVVEGEDRLKFVAHLEEFGGYTRHG